MSSRFSFLSVFSFEEESVLERTQAVWVFSIVIKFNRVKKKKGKQKDVVGNFLVLFVFSIVEKWVPYKGRDCVFLDKSCDRAEGPENVSLFYLFPYFYLCIISTHLCLFISNSVSNPPFPLMLLLSH